MATLLLFLFLPGRFPVGISMRRLKYIGRIRIGRFLPANACIVIVLTGLLYGRLCLRRGSLLNLRQLLRSLLLRLNLFQFLVVVLKIHI